MKIIILLITVSSIIAYKYDNSIEKITSAGSKMFITKMKYDSIKKKLSTNLSFQHNIELQDTIRLNTFTQLPDDIQGCTCYFYLSKFDQKKKKYIMTENFGQFSYISINGKMQKFNLFDFKDKLYYFYSRGIYKLKIKFKNKIESDSEDFIIKGVLMLFKDKKLLIKRDIIGECGC